MLGKPVIIKPITPTRIGVAFDSSVYVIIKALTRFIIINFPTKRVNVICFTLFVIQTTLVV